VDLLLINQYGSDEGLPDLTDGVSLPVLQDTAEDAVFGAYNASKWYLYLIDRDGQLVLLHYDLDYDADEARLLAEIAAVVDP
jgi:hypothetical protein